MKIPYPLLRNWITLDYHVHREKLPESFFHIKKGKIPQLLVKIIKVWNFLEQMQKFPMTLGKKMEFLAQIKKSSFALFKKSKFLNCLKKMGLFVEPFGQTSNIQEVHRMKQRVLESLA